MSFTSPFFYVLLLAFVPLYWAIPSQMLRRRLLVFGSFLFYAAWDVRFFSLLIISGLADYLISIKIDRLDSETPLCKKLLWLSVSINVGILGFFKYFNFFIDSANTALQTVGFAGSIPMLQLVLPLGISFYTFQTMSYTIDVYRRSIRVERNFLDYFLYVSFFPQLVAGPIERAANLLPQFLKKQHFEFWQFADGLFLIVMGMSLKLLVADEFGRTVDYFYHAPVQNAAFGWAAVFGFGFQIYVDFSSYTMIARGAAKLFGIELMKNFEQPYLSANPSEFWRRWHISLSTWFRDYLYIPLGGNRHRWARNILITMIIAGLWHGASVMFALWGLYHAVLLLIFRYVRLPRLIGVPVTFLLINLGWILFRSQTWSQATQVFQSLTAFNDLPAQYHAAVYQVAYWGAFVIAIDLLLRFRPIVKKHITQAIEVVQYWSADSYVKLSLASFIAFFTLHFSRTSASGFIYFNF